MVFIKDILNAAVDAPLKLITHMAFSISILLAAFILYKLYEKTVHRIIERIVDNTKSNLLKTLKDSFKQPMKFLILCFGVYAAVMNILSFPLLTLTYAGTKAFATKLLRISIIIAFVNGFSNASYGIIRGIEGFNTKLDLVLDQTIMNFSAKLLKVVIIAFGVVIVVSELGYDVNGLIAGIGLGGLTFALAAQDTASNFFGGIVILLDKPFKAGDWIQTPSIEGVVCEISFRSTTIKNFNDTVTVVPNSKLANEVIVNWSKMKKRKIVTTLSLTYDTPKENLIAIVDDINEFLQNSADVNPSDSFAVFNEYSASSLDIMVNYFTMSTTMLEHYAEKQRVNLKLMDIVQKHGARFAFPSTSVYIEKN